MFVLKIIKPGYEILSPINGEEILKHIELCGRVCYKSEDRITDESCKKFVTDIIRRGHESVLEHASFSIRFICDRGVSHEIVRHRIASFCLSGDTVLVAHTGSSKRSPKKWTIKQL